MRQVLAIAKRLEKKINLIVRHQQVALPDWLNPEVLSREAKELADRNRKIEAVEHHRLSTGADFAETCKLIENYLRNRSNGGRFGRRLGVWLPRQQGSRAT